MSIFLDIVLSNLDVTGLEERRVHWGDEVHSTDPPQYIFGHLTFMLISTPAHVAKLLPAPLRDVPRCLNVAGEVLGDWSYGALDPGRERDLRDFIACIGESNAAWAVVYD